MDGKHVQLKGPFNSDRTVLIISRHLTYKFLYVDVGCNGRISGRGVFRNSSLFNALSLNMLNIPLSKSEILPVVVADDAFSLKTYMMRPYASKTYLLKKGSSIII